MGILTRMSGWKLGSLVSELVYFTYLGDFFTTYLYRGEKIKLLNTMHIPVNFPPCWWSNRDFFKYSCYGGSTWACLKIKPGPMLFSEKQIEPGPR